MSNLPVGLSICYDLHLNGSGCSEGNFDLDFDTCPYNDRNILLEEIREEEPHLVKPEQLAEVLKMFEVANPVIIDNVIKLVVSQAKFDF